MLPQVQYMKKGEVYRIKNRKTGMYLTSGPDVTCSPWFLGKITQYWLCQQIKPTMYQIVSLQSGQVLTRNQNINIEKGKWLSNQFWDLQRAQITKQGNYFWITGQDDNTKYLFGSGASDKVSMRTFDCTLFVSNWKFERIDDTQQLGGCCVLKSNLTQMVIDVPQGSHKQGVNIIQYIYNGRGNQRWVLQKFKKQYIIRNICSSMILSPQNKVLKSGTKIIQTQFTNQPCQKWIIIKSLNQQIDAFMICNSEDQKLFLGVSSTRESSNIILTSQKQKSYWKLQGNLPQMLLRDQQMKQYK